MKQKDLPFFKLVPRQVLPGCDSLLSSDIKHKDYHNNMNSNIFTNWMQSQLNTTLNSLEKPCVVIRDVALHHLEQSNKALIVSSKKANIVS